MKYNIVYRVELSVQVMKDLLYGQYGKIVGLVQ